MADPVAMLQGAAGMNPETEWPAADIERLRALYAEDHTLARIGEMMGRSKNSIVGKVRRLGLPMPGAPRPRPAEAEAAPATPAELPPPPPPEPAPEPAPAPPPPPPRRGSCQWPIGEPRHPEFRFCGDPLSPLTRLPYCAAHAARAVSARKEPAA